MMLSLLLLAVLFIAALVNGFLYIPPKLLFSWVQSLVTCNKVSDVSTAATSLSPKEKKNTNYRDELKRVFATFDKNGDGFITRQELGESLNCIGFTTSEREVAAMVERLDANGDGLIDLDEFCELYLSMGSGKDGEGGGSEEEVGEEDLKEAFEVFDGNKDGFITVDELGMVLSSLGMKQGMRMQDCKEMISKVDMDGDGMVNFEEFKQMMRAGGKLVAVS